MIKHGWTRAFGAAHHEDEVDSSFSGPSHSLRAFEVQNDSQDRFAANGGHLSLLILSRIAIAMRVEGRFTKTENP